MCDYSLHYVKSRPAKVGDKLTTRDFVHGYARVRGTGRCKRRSLRFAGNRVVVCQRCHLLADRSVGLAPGLT